mmetsp:Transcript_10591/g.25578  ORF Transcript_10591/g.25578 Transcript_10591/m.25578 type:complete len:280 (+) Transcript_10591:662-1501(+)
MSSLLTLYLFFKHDAVAEMLLPYSFGKPLHAIALSCSKYILQMEDLRKKDHSLASRVIWQAVINLMGEAENVLAMEGVALSRKVIDNLDSAETKFYDAIRHDLLVFYGAYELAAESALKRGNEFPKAAVGVFTIMMETFHRGVALYAMARRTRRRKYLNPARRIRKTIKKWGKNGNPNVRHYICFLDAEHSAVSKRYKEAEVHYQQAIKIAAKTGYLHHAGLFNERYADLLKVHMKNEEEAVYRLQEAIRWYGEWGAALKVKMLIELVSTERGEARTED